MKKLVSLVLSAIKEIVSLGLSAILRVVGAIIAVIILTGAMTNDSASKSTITAMENPTSDVVKIEEETETESETSSEIEVIPIETESTTIEETTTANPVGEDTYICEEYLVYIYEVSDLYNVSPELIMAIIERESSGIANQVTGDCKGLMQVSERWHKGRMERLGVSSLYDPYGNILVGTDYFMELATRYDDLGYVLMKYNGDSDANDYLEGKCEMSKYAQGIINRSEQLERLHGK